MRISIIVPVFNDVRVGRALESILSQQHGHDLETIVVDASSTDGTRQVLERYRDKVSVLISEPDDGIYDGMNKGICHATGDVVGILNADDQYNDPLVVRDVADAFVQNGDVDACYGNLIYTDENRETVRYWKSGYYWRMKWFLGWMPPHPTFFVRRCVYERHGVFDLQYPIAADYELMLRLIFRHGIKMTYLNRTLVKMAPGGNSTKTVKNIIKANLEVGRAWRNNGLWGRFLIPVFKPSRKIFQLVSRP